MSAFVSSSCDYVSSAFGFHPLSETVYFAALSFFRLISSFHFVLTYFCREFPNIIFFTEQV